MKAVAIKKGSREKAVGLQDMGTLRCDSCGEEFFISHSPASADRSFAEKQARWLDKVLADRQQIELGKCVPTDKACQSVASQTSGFERAPWLSLEYLRARVYISRLPADRGRKEIAMGFLAWIVVGLIAGWLTGQVMKGGGYGVVVDIILGILGGVLGGWVFGLLGIWPGGGMIGSIVVAFVGAVILVWITRLLKRA